LTLSQLPKTGKPSLPAQIHAQEEMPIRELRELREREAAFAQLP
jgi:hypothetical protein